MGYWNQGADGTSLHRNKTGLIWGDSPADIVDDAIDIGREPTPEELRAGFAFSLNALDFDYDGNRLTPAE